MKYIILIVMGLSLAGKFSSANETISSGTFMENPGNCLTADTIKVVSSPELNLLTAAWMKEYSRLNPTVAFSISNNLVNPELKPNTISFLSADPKNSPDKKEWWAIGIGHNAVVPVISVKNPLLSEILQQGISSDKLARLISSEKPLWSDFVKGANSSPLHFYLADNTSLLNDLAEFSGSNASEIKGNKVSGSSEVVKALQNDPNGIGFCLLSEIRQPGTNNLLENIKLLPIDRNSNGRIDSFENIYDNPDDLTRGVWVGKYPHTLCATIYVTAKERPVDKNTQAFLTWIMTGGDQYLSLAGYTTLASIEKKANLNALLNNLSNSPQTDIPAPSRAWLIIMAGVVIIAAVSAMVLRALYTSKVLATPPQVQVKSLLNESMVDAPKGIYFDKSHFWTFMEKEGTVRIGVDDFIQHLTGTITGIKMKENGDQVRRGEKILTLIREGKQLNLYSPVSGIIRERNNKLFTNSSMINSEPYQEGWAYMIEPKNWVREIQFMFMADTYKEWLKFEFKRLRSFFETSVMSNKSVYAQLILQDGGELTDNVLSDLGPEIWEDFQTNFIDTSK